MYGDFKMIYEFLLERRPLSLQASGKSKEKWKNFIFQEAKKNFPKIALLEEDLHVMIIHLCNQDYIDVDNIIKPILDALEGVFYDDDSNIIDVESHRRLFIGSFDITKYPKELIRGIYSEEECVFVRVTNSQPLERFIL
jgi:hypothetical protein